MCRYINMKIKVEQSDGNAYYRCIRTIWAMCNVPAYRKNYIANVWNASECFFRILIKYTWGIKYYGISLLTLYFVFVHGVSHRASKRRWQFLTHTLQPYRYNFGKYMNIFIPLGLLNALLPFGTKPLPNPMLTDCQIRM